MPKNTTEIFIPGKAYEIMMSSDFVTGKVTDEAREARVALKNGERRNKGRGYRVLVNLNENASTFLCDWLSTYLNAPEYSKLGTAEALAIRTITDRICEIADVCATARDKRKEAAARRVATMLAGKERAAAERREQEIEQAQEALGSLKAQVPAWTDEYAQVLKKATATNDMEKARKLFNKLDALQNNIIRSRQQIKNLEAKVA